MDLEWTGGLRLCPPVHSGRVPPFAIARLGFLAGNPGRIPGQSVRLFSHTAESCIFSCRIPERDTLGECSALFATAESRIFSCRIPEQSVRLLRHTAESRIFSCRNT